MHILVRLNTYIISIFSIISIQKIFISQNSILYKSQVTKEKANPMNINNEI